MCCRCVIPAYVFGAPVHLSPSPSGSSMPDRHSAAMPASPQSQGNKALDLRSHSAHAGSVPPPPEAPVTCIELLRLLSMFRSAVHEFRSCLHSWIQDLGSAPSVVDAIQAAHSADAELFPRFVALGARPQPPDAAEMQDFVSVMGTLSSWSITIWQEFVRHFPVVRHPIMQSLRVQRLSSQMHRWRRCLFLDEAAPSASPLQVQVLSPSSSPPRARKRQQRSRKCRSVKSPETTEKRARACVPSPALVAGRWFQ